MRFIRFCVAALGVLLAGVVMGNIAATLTGIPDLWIIGWDTLFVALSGAAAYSAVFGRR
jgi:hypothetical protein